MPSARRPTLEDVARRAGVSRALVSLALNDSPKVADSSRTAIIAAAAELGYRPNLAARNLAARRTNTIGVLLNDLHNTFFADVFDGLSAAAADEGRQLLLTTARNRRAGEREAVESLIEHRVDGIVLVSPRVPSSVITTLAAGIPTVVVGRVVRDDAVDCVANDDREGARLAVEHLASLGHDRIVHVSGGNGAGSAARATGFLQAAKNLGLHGVEVLPGDFTEEAGAEAVRQLLGRPHFPTAVFGANDLVAVGALDVLLDAGKRVPEDVAVLGYDNSAVARMAHVRLTSVDQSTDRLGRVAVELLLERIGGRRSRRVELVHPTLMVRRSTDPSA